MSDNMMNAYRNVDKLQEQSRPEWRPTTDTQKVVDGALSIDNIGSFLANALPKINPQVAQQISAPVVPDGAIPITENGAPLMTGMPTGIACAPIAIPQKEVVFESDGVQFKVVGGVVYKKTWIEMTNDPEYKIVENKIFHLEWQKIKE